MPAPEAVTPTFVPVVRGPILPGRPEIAANPRARSAKLRVIERTDAPAPAQADPSARRTLRSASR
jgi:16S rRNA (cytosine1402-N4)-methyltransferase